MRILLVAFLVCMVSAAAHTAMAQEPDVTDIVAANDAFTAQPDSNTRAALVSALNAYNDDPTVQSVNAYIGLMMHDGAGDSHEQTYASASAATAHFEPIADIIPKQYLEARFLAAVALFNDKQHRDAMLEMAHVEGRARAYTDATGERPDWASFLKWKSDAWGMAMNAYFESARENHPDDDEIQAILASYGTDVASRNALAARSLDDKGLRFCRGKMIQRPAMKYPASRDSKSQFGAVILQMDLNADGDVINPRVLASVPENVFDEKSLRVVGKWKFKPKDRDAVGVTCRLERSNLVQPLTFELR